MVKIEDEDYVGIKFSEHKELLTIKGRYEELSKREKTIVTWGGHDISTLTTPYPQDLTPKYQKTTVYCDKNSVRAKN